MSYARFVCDTIGRGALLTMLYLLIVIAIGWVATAALLSV
jgi:hypothetical protein